MTLTADNLSTYLGDDVDQARAEFLIDMGTKRAALFTGAPVPDAADPIILEVKEPRWLHLLPMTSDS